MLVAIAIPVFTNQLKKSKLATATANARSITAEYVADCLAPEDQNDPKTPKYSELNSKFSGNLGVDGASAEAADGVVTVEYDDLSATFDIDDDFED